MLMELLTVVAEELRSTGRVRIAPEKGLEPFVNPQTAVVSSGLSFGSLIL
jgi:hypothetical protein